MTPVAECLPGCNLLPRHYGHCMQVNPAPKSKDDWLIRYVDPDVERRYQERKAERPARRRR